MLLPHMVVKGKVGSIPVQFYCLSLHIKSIEIACGISDVWAGSMYWLSSKWSEQIWYELYNCFAVFEPRSPGLVCMTHFLDLLTRLNRRSTIVARTRTTVAAGSPLLWLTERRSQIQVVYFSQSELVQPFSPGHSRDPSIASAIKILQVSIQIFRCFL